MSTRIFTPRSKQYAFAALALVTMLTLGFWGLSTKQLLLHPQQATSPDFDLGRLPLSFEANAGQADSSVHFLARQPQGTLLFSDSTVYIVIPQGTDGKARPGDEKAALKGMDEAAAKFRIVRMEFLGANPQPQVRAGDALPGKVNYLLGNDPSQWHTNLPTYESITYGELYPGISLDYTGTHASLKGTYNLAPGADPAGIRWRYEGARSVSVDDMGRLQITAASTSDAAPLALTEDAPVAWQEIGGQRVPVSARYDVAQDGAIGFALGSYDPSYPLTIDPTLTFSSYLGGSGHDWAEAIATDSNGNIYLTGYTNSSDFPTVNPYQPTYAGFSDAFVTKIDPNVSAIVYSTYLGGNLIEEGYGITVDGAGHAYVTGYTRSANFPTANAYQPVWAGLYDAFLCKLSVDGSGLVYSTYLGSTGNDYGYGVAVDASGSAHLVGTTDSIAFPTRNAYQPIIGGNLDAFVTKFNPDGASLSFSTFFGGNSSDRGDSIALHSSGSIHIDGDTHSTNFPVVNAFQPQCAGGCSAGDAFVARFQPGGQQLVFSTYLGGGIGDNAHAIAVDGAGNTYAAGITDSFSFPVYAAFQSSQRGFSDAFLTKLNPQGQLGVPGTFSTYLGGGGGDTATGLAVNSAGNAYISGFTQSQDFPIFNAIFPQLAGFEDGYVTKFAADGQSLAYSTYYGGSNGREEVGARDIALDSAGNAYIVGATQSTNLPLVNAVQNANAGGYDLFVARIDDQGQAATPTPNACNTQYTITESTGAVIVPGTQFVGFSGNITLPFPFRLYDNTYTDAFASEYGYLSFGDSFIPHINQCLPASAPSHAMLPFWDNIGFPEGNSGIFTSVTGSAPNRIFNIEWRNSYVPGGGRADFQILLYEADQHFEYVYGPVALGGHSATIGVQEDYFGRYTQYSCNTSSVTAGLKLTFSRPSCALTPSTATPTRTLSPTITGTPPTFTPTRTSTSTRTSTHTPTITNTPTITRTPTAVPSYTPQTGTWEHQAPLPSGATYNDIDMISPTEGWAAGQYLGNGGVVVHTTDGGATWEYGTTGVEEPNYSVRFLDSMHGWVSSNNAVFYTTDGGRTWGEGQGLAGSLYFMDFATINDGFATTGVDRGYFRTTDGGRTWQFRSMPRDVAGIQFFDANNGIASTETGVFHTTDRGNTWSFTPGHGGSFFLNHNLGWAVIGDVAERTTDGGATWQTGSMPGGAWAYDAHFVDAQNGWASGAGFQILRTTDGGMTWDFSRPPDTYPYLNYDSWAIDFGSATHGIAVGGYSGGALAGGGVILRTSDMGTTWTPGVNGTDTTTHSIFALNQTHAWTANEYGESQWTTDGGAHWNVSSVIEGGDMYDVEFADPLNGWIVGDFGYVYRSTNGGRNWIRQFPNTQGRPVRGVEVINSQTVIVVGGGVGGAVAERTTDGGATWTSFNAQNGSILFDVFFANQTTGWIVGNNGRISKSTDGGVTWTPQTSGVTSQLNRVSFADDNNGWVVGGFSATILRTTNGGQT